MITAVKQNQFKFANLHLRQLTRYLIAAIQFRKHVIRFKIVFENSQFYVIIINILMLCYYKLINRIERPQNRFQLIFFSYTCFEV